MSNRSRLDQRPVRRGPTDLATSSRTSGPPPSVASYAVPPAKQPRRTCKRSVLLTTVLIIGDLVCLSIAAIIALLLTGQTDTVGWLVVGVVLIVVFGTPLLCLLGFLALCVTTIRHAGRGWRPRPTPERPAPEPIYIGEVIDPDA